MTEQTFVRIDEERVKIIPLIVRISDAIRRVLILLATIVLSILPTAYSMHVQLKYVSCN